MPDNPLDLEERTTEPPDPNRPRPTRIRRLAMGCLVLMALIFALLAVVYQSAQGLPTFYEESLAIPFEELAESGANFENRVLDVQNASQRAGEWRTEFTEAQINGWLAVDLPRKFPDWLPPRIADPRVNLGPGEMRIAFQYQSSRIQAIIVITLDAFLTDRENEIGVRLRSVQSGMLPLPVQRIADEVTKQLQQRGIPATWAEIGNDPTALLTLPRSLVDIDDRFSVVVTGIEVEEGTVVLSGKTVPR